MYIYIYTYVCIYIYIYIYSKVQISQGLGSFFQIELLTTGRTNILHVEQFIEISISRFTSFIDKREPLCSCLTIIALTTTKKNN